MSDYDVIVIGSGPGAAAAISTFSNDHSLAIVEEGNWATKELINSGIGNRLSSFYRKAGARVIFGREVLPFGEAQVVGGGATINGGVLWNLPASVERYWRDTIIGFDDDFFRKYRRFEDYWKEKLGGQTYILGEISGNRPSMILRQTAIRLGWNVEAVNRAIKGCQNNNQCGFGCPVQAKNTLTTFFAGNNKRIISGTKAVKIDNTSAKRVVVRCRIGNKDEFNITAKKLVLSAGLYETPALLARSGLVPFYQRFDSDHHINFKFLLRFSYPINPQNATLFTHQITEFTDQHAYVAATALTPHLFRSWQAFGDAPDPKEYSYYAGYVVQFAAPKAVKSLILGSQIFSQFCVEHARRRSTDLIDTIVRPFFHESGAEACFIVTNQGLVNLEKLAGIPRPQLLSVHGMSSLSPHRNPGTEILNPDLTLRNDERIIIADASVLPSFIGESPQLSIMSYIKSVIRK